MFGSQGRASLPLLVQLSSEAPGQLCPGQAARTIRHKVNSWQGVLCPGQQVPHLGTLQTFSANLISNWISE